MDREAQLEAIIEVFGRLDIAVRLERLGGGGGGLCALRGQRVLFIDLDADVATRLDRSVGALASLPELDSVYLTPALREHIARTQGSGQQT
jgi:hypothetical protein